MTLEYDTDEDELTLYFNGEKVVETRTADVEAPMSINVFYRGKVDTDTQVELRIGNVDFNTIVGSSFGGSPFIMDVKVYADGCYNDVVTGFPDDFLCA